MQVFGSAPVTLSVEDKKFDLVVVVDPSHLVIGHVLLHVKLTKTCAGHVIGLNCQILRQ